MSLLIQKFDTFLGHPGVEEDDIVSVEVCHVKFVCIWVKYLEFAIKDVRSQIAHNELLAEEFMDVIFAYKVFPSGQP